MQRTLIGILSLLFASFTFAVPASAFDLPQCAPFPAETSHFVLIAENNVIFEPQSPGSGRIINGNVLVTNPTPFKVGSDTGTGFIKVGANTNIQGTVIAHTLLLPDGGATITHCIADVIVANTPAAKASCGTGFPVVGTPFTDYAAAHPACMGSLTASNICGPTPVANACVNGKPKLTVGLGFPTPAQAAAGLTDPLTPGCYGALLLENGAVLNLAPGTFTFASVKMNAGSKLLGGPSTVNVNLDFKTDAGVSISDIDLNIAFNTTAEVAKIFNNSTLSNVVINAPLGKCHLHTGTALTECSEACCKVLDVQPITAAVCEPPRDLYCPCPQGTRFLNPWQINPNDDPGAVIVGDLQDSRTCVVCLAGEHPPAFPTCPPAP